MLLGVELKRLKAAFDQGHLVLGVVDDEAGIDANGLAITAQDTGADGVEGPDGQLINGAARQLPQALLHLPGRLVGEGDRHDAVRADPTDLDEVGDAMGDNPCLAAPGPGQNQHRPTDRLNSLSLRRIEVGKNVHQFIITFHLGAFERRQYDPIPIFIDSNKIKITVMHQAIYSTLYSYQVRQTQLPGHNNLRIDV